MPGSGEGGISEGDYTIYPLRSSLRHLHTTSNPYEFVDVDGEHLYVRYEERQDPLPSLYSTEVYDLATLRLLGTNQEAFINPIIYPRNHRSSEQVAGYFIDPNVSEEGLLFGTGSYRTTSITELALIDTQAGVIRVTQLPDVYYAKPIHIISQTSVLITYMLNSQFQYGILQYGEEEMILSPDPEVISDALLKEMAGRQLPAAYSSISGAGEEKSSVFLTLARIIYPAMLQCNYRWNPSGAVDLTTGDFATGVALEYIHMGHGFDFIDGAPVSDEYSIPTYLVPFGEIDSLAKSLFPEMEGNAVAMPHWTYGLWLNEETNCYQLRVHDSVGTQYQALPQASLLSVSYDETTGRLEMIISYWMRNLVDGVMSFPCTVRMAVEYGAPDDFHYLSLEILGMPV